MSIKPKKILCLYSVMDHLVRSKGIGYIALNWTIL